MLTRWIRWHSLVGYIFFFNPEHQGIYFRNDGVWQAVYSIAGTGSEFCKVTAFVGKKDHLFSFLWEVVIYFPSFERKGIIFLSIHVISIKIIFENYARTFVRNWSNKSPRRLVLSWFVRSADGVAVNGSFSYLILDKTWSPWAYVSFTVTLYSPSGCRYWERQPR